MKNNVIMRKHFEGIYGFSRDAEEKFLVDVGVVTASNQVVDQIGQELEENSAQIKLFKERYEKSQDPQDKAAFTTMKR